MAAHLSIEESLAEVLAAHQWYDATTDSEDPATGCTGCDDWFGDENAVDDGTFAKHVAAALAPVIREQEAEAWAAGVATALNHAILNKDGITLRLEHLDGRPWANPYEEQR